MEFDEYEYLEKEAEALEPPKDYNGVQHKERRRDGEDRQKGDDRSRKSRVSDDAKDRRHGEDRHRQDDRSKKTRVFDGNTDRWERSERDREHGSERERQKERESSDRRDKPDRDNREKDRRDRERSIRDWEDNAGGWGRGYKGRFFNRNRDFERGQNGGRGREREDRHFDREKEHGGSRYPREKKEKKDDTATTELEVDPERDQRTVFAFQLSLRASERDLYNFFSKAGKVRDVKLIMDRSSRRSKGVGYVEFYDAMSVPMAIAMTGQPLLGQPVMVKPSEAEKNLVASTAAAMGMGPYSGGARRLYVGNLHYEITDVQLRQVFEPFGAVELVQLPTEPETGQCKGYGFIQFARLEDARSAQASLNGSLELAGRVIKVLAVTEQMSMQEPGLIAGELDDDEGGGLSLTARSRTLLMQKLDRSGTVTSVASSSAPLGASLGLLPTVSTNTAPALVSSSTLGQSGMMGVVGLPNVGLAATASAVVAIGVPTECLLLKNMFDPSTETDPDFDLDIKDEVQLECSKFGAVKHIYVEKMSAGHVYIRFDLLSSATGAQRALHGRWFAGKMITVTFLTPQEYDAKFPESK